MDALADTVLPLVQAGVSPAEILARTGIRMSLLDMTRYCRAIQPDTRSQAKRLIDAEALAITADVIDHGQPKDKLMLLRGRGVLDEPASTGVTIVIGGQDVTVNLGIAVVSRDRDTV